MKQLRPMCCVLFSFEENRALNYRYWYAYDHEGD